MSEAKPESVTEALLWLREAAAIEKEVRAITPRLRACLDTLERIAAGVRARRTNATETLYRLSVDAPEQFPSLSAHVGDTIALNFATTGTIEAQVAEIARRAGLLDL